MPIVNDLLTGNRGGGPRMFLHLNWHATELYMLCKHILRFRDLPKFSGMPGMPKLVSGVL